MNIYIYTYICTKVTVYILISVDNRNAKKLDLQRRASMAVFIWCKIGINDTND